MAFGVHAGVKNKLGRQSGLRATVGRRREGESIWKNHGITGKGMESTKPLLFDSNDINELEYQRPGALRMTRRWLTLRNVEEAKMVQDDYRPIKYAARRAYQLARTGKFRDFASIEQAIVDEGYGECVPWLEREGVISALLAICECSRDANRIAARA
jgi:hypothetical protein